MTLKLKTNRNYFVYERDCFLVNAPLFTLTFFSDIMKNRNIQIEIKIFNFVNGLRILSGNFQGMMRGMYN